MKKIPKEQKGFAFIITILCLALMSILGFAIIGVTTSTFKMAKVDSRSQSSYYIAEAGINYMIDEINTEVHNNKVKYKTSAELFQYIENKFTKDTHTLDNFEKNIGEQPKAFITVSQVGMDEDSRDYKIESVGRIGNSTRTVSSVISLKWSSGGETSDLNDIFLYSPGLSYDGDEINGDGTIIIKNIYNLNGGVKINVKYIYIKESAIGIVGGQFGNKENPGVIHANKGISFGTYGEVYGDIYVKGNFTPGGAIFYGNVYVDGDIDFSHFDYMGNIKNVEYTGKIINNTKNLNISKFKKVSIVPNFTVPELHFKAKEEQWYIQNNYEILGNIKNREIKNKDRLFVESIEGKPSNTNEAEDIVIISKGDIILNGWFGKMTGTLISLNGKVYINQGIFDGVILSKTGFYSNAGGSKITKGKISEPIPFEIYNGSGAGSGSEENQVNKLEIKTPIREE